MNTDLSVLKIKAAAYDQIKWKLAQHETYDTIGLQVDTIVEDTEKMLIDAQIDTHALNERLVQSRMRRLLSTQFVYVSSTQYPKIENTPGQEQWLRRTDYLFEISTNVDEAYEQLCERETQLFQTEDEMTVFYHGNFLWTVSSYPDQDKIRATCSVYCAHKWEGQWHAEPSHAPKVKILNLNTHNPDGSERSDNISFPMRLRPECG
jgi:hypothetical protein